MPVLAKHRQSSRLLESIITPVLHLGSLTVGAGPLWKFNRGSRREPRVGSAPISVTDGTADHFAVALKNDRQAASFGDVRSGRDAGTNA